MDELLAAAGSVAVEITPWIPVIASAVLAVVAGIFAWLNRRGGEKSRREPTWVELTNENRLLRTDVANAADALRTSAGALNRREQDLLDLRAEFDEFRDDTKTMMKAHSQALLEASAQWPTDRPGPVFSPWVVEKLDDTMPPKWRTRRRRRAT